MNKFTITTIFFITLFNKLSCEDLTTETASIDLISSCKEVAGTKCKLQQDQLAFFFFHVEKVNYIYRNQPENKFYALNVEFRRSNPTDKAWQLNADVDFKGSEGKQLTLSLKLNGQLKSEHKFPAQRESWQFVLNNLKE